MEDKEKAFEFLAHSVDKGLKDYERILSHDDLAFLRIQPEFDEFRSNGFRLTKKQESEQTVDQKVDRPMNDVLLAQLNRLSELRKKGVLTEQEFLRERKKVMAR